MTTTNTYIAYKIKGTKLLPSVINFNGPYIRCIDFKDAVCKEKKINLSSGDVELVVQDEQSGKEFNDYDIIPRMSQVLVSRRVIGDITAIQSDRQEPAKLLVPPHPEMSGSVTVAFAEQQQQLKKRKVDESGSPTPKIWGKQAKLMAENIPAGRASPDVVEHCVVKRAVGIPSTKLMVVDGPNYMGAVLTKSGHYAVSKIDAQAYNEAENLRKSLSPAPSPVKRMTPPPPELVCMLCQEMCREAALAPCCNTSFCDECIRDELLTSEEQLCPKCRQPCPPSSLLPNWDVRKAVADFTSGIGYGEKKEIALAETRKLNQVETSAEVEQKIVKKEEEIVSPVPTPPVLPAADVTALSQFYWNNYVNQLSNYYMLLAQQQQQQQQLANYFQYQQQQQSSQIKPAPKPSSPSRHRDESHYKERQRHPSNRRR